MIDKANRCFVRVRDHFTRLEALGKAKNLYGQASGTKKSLEMIRASGTEIPQEMIDVFAEQEKIYKAEATKLCVGPLSDSDLTLSPLGLPFRFVEDRFRGSFDPYGSNINLIRPETASQIITSLEITRELTEEPLVNVTSVPAEHVEVPEGRDLGERPENENLEEVPGKDNLEIGNTPVREEETENVGIEDPVLVSDSSSEGREDGEEKDDRVKETSPSQPVEEDPTAAATEDPVGPSALGMPEEDIARRWNVSVRVPPSGEATKLCVGPLSDSDLTLSPLGLPSRFVEDRFRGSFDPYGSNVNLIRPETASQIITSLEITGESTEEPLVDVTSIPAEHVEVPEGGDLRECPENEDLEEVPGKDNFEIGNTPVREEETENVGIEDPVLVSDSSSEGREDGEEVDDRVKETSPSQPVEEDPTAAATEDPVSPSALGTPEEVGQDTVP
ncbi:hypothetical protein F2Q69_00041134 [Brassica cretica]|uniref:Uncharacterized protein n=1 Tax=Brassica cretica TaxID=69181 RepID=A0A8S9NLF6_BRACR|nr:hypothetical protein F2Q69_00041134 [Brassica cretica]